MDILILGGTWFVGRDIVETLLTEGGHNITLFNRGKTNADLFPEVEHITGDRYTYDLRQLAGRKWDAVIDCCGYFPDDVERWGRFMKDRTDRYIFISTVSVFGADPNNQHPYTEDKETLACTPEMAMDKSMEYYGHRKAECERRLLAIEGLNTTILRPALIFGPYDPFDRLYYWLYRAARQEVFLMPGTADDTISYTYVKDLSQAVLSAIKKQPENQVFNLSTHTPVSLRQMVGTTCEILNTQPQIVDITPEFAQQHELSEWTDLPLWINGHYYLFDNTQAIQQLGLRPTPLKQALQVTLDYYASLNWPVPKYGLPADKEQSLLALAKCYA